MPYNPQTQYRGDMYLADSSGSRAAWGAIAQFVGGMLEKSKEEAKLAKQLRTLGKTLYADDEAKVAELEKMGLPELQGTISGTFAKQDLQRRDLANQKVLSEMASATQDQLAAGEIGGFLETLNAGTNTMEGLAKASYKYPNAARLFGNGLLRLFADEQQAGAPEDWQSAQGTGFVFNRQTGQFQVDPVSKFKAQAENKTTAAPAAGKMTDVEKAHLTQLQTEHKGLLEDLSEATKKLRANKNKRNEELVRAADAAIKEFRAQRVPPAWQHIFGGAAVPVQPGTGIPTAPAAGAPPAAAPAAGGVPFKPGLGGTNLMRLPNGVTIRRLE